MGPRKVLIALAILMSAWFLGRVQAQSNAKVWRAGVYEDSMHDINVIDMSGVCLYYVMTYDANVALAAIPKTQLPPGIGCQ